MCEYLIQIDKKIFYIFTLLIIINIAYINFYWKVDNQTKYVENKHFFTKLYIKSLFWKILKGLEM